MWKREIEMSISLKVAITRCLSTLTIGAKI